MGMECQVETTGPSEAPDFYLHRARSVSSLEMRRLFWKEGPAGSTEKIAEVRRLQNLSSLQDIYYELGGRSLAVQGSIPVHLPVQALVALAKEMVAQVASAPEGVHIHREFVLGKDVMRLQLLPLPDSCGRYTSWQVPENHVGWVGWLTADTVRAAVAEKEKRFAAYKRSGIARRDLLLVADRLQASGMFRYDETQGRFERGGFDSVYFLSYPESAHLIG